MQKRTLILVSLTMFATACGQNNANSQPVQSPARNNQSTGIGQNAVLPQANGTAAQAQAVVPQAWVGLWQTNCHSAPSRSGMYLINSLTIGANGSTSSTVNEYSDDRCQQQTGVNNATFTLTVGAASSAIPGATEITEKFSTATIQPTTQSSAAQNTSDFSGLASKAVACAALTFSAGQTTDVSACMKAVHPTNYTVFAVLGNTLYRGDCNQSQCNSPDTRANALNTAVTYNKAK